MEKELLDVGRSLRASDGVLEDQAERGQVLRLTEEEARTYPHLVIASLGGQSDGQAQRSDFSKRPVRRSNGVPVNRWRHIRELQLRQTSKGQCAKNRRSVRRRSHQPQTSPRHTDRYLLRHAIGTSCHPKSNLAQPFTSTRLEQSVSRLQVTAGLGCHRPLGVWRSICWVMLHARGTCSWRTTFSEKPAVRRTEQR